MALPSRFDRASVGAIVETLGTTVPESLGTFEKADPESIPLRLDWTGWTGRKVTLLDGATVEVKLLEARVWLLP